MTFSIEFNYLTMTRVSIEIETALSSPQFSVGHLGLIINWLIVFLVLELVLVSVLELVSVLLVMLVILLMLLMLFMLTILVVISSVDAGVGGVGGVVSFLS